MKEVYVVPMVHTVQELGSLEKRIMETRLRLFGAEQTEKFFDQVEQYWQEAERKIEGAGLFQPEIAAGAQIFIDSLPNVNEYIVQKVLQDLIRQGSPAYKIIDRLQKAGAKVWGTEDTNLLLEEYRYWQDVASGKKIIDILEIEKLLRARDRAITRRINLVMSENGEIGIVFIGAKHNLMFKTVKIINL
ncbi:MAG: hypothetical protein PHU56_00095 [Candidatus Pacebacteria bacterium]|nr:hypothetical protein [Candidatus Paceibacterota bacterium]